MLVPFIYHILICSYGWTIDYINEQVTIPQIIFLLEQIKQNPPTAIMSFGFGEKNMEKKNLEQLSKFGDKVKVESILDKKSVKSVVRLRDNKRLK